MTTPPEERRDPQDERLVSTFLEATQDLSLREVKRRTRIAAETARRLRNDDWATLHAATLRSIKGYLVSRGLWRDETPDGAPSSEEDLPYSEAEELVRSFRRFHELGVFSHLGEDLTEDRFARAIVRAAEDDGLPDRNPAEMAKLLRWYAEVISPENPTPRPEAGAHDSARRASAGSR